MGSPASIALFPNQGQPPQPSDGDAATGAEKRNAPRYPASEVPSITGLRMSPHGAEASLVNLSTTGLLAECAVRLKTGSTVTLRAESMDQNPVPGQGLEFRADWPHWTPPGRIVPNSDTTHYPLKVTQPAPYGYNGQWLQMDCLSITPAPPPH